MNIEKKEYESPKMTVIEMVAQTALLDCSGDCFIESDNDEEIIDAE